MEHGGAARHACVHMEELEMQGAAGMLASGELGMCLHLFSAKADLQPLRDFYKIDKYSKNSEIFTQYIRHIYVCAVKISAPSELFCSSK